METVILRKMDFHLSVATPFHFLKRFLLAGDAETLEILLAHVRSVLQPCRSPSLAPWLT